MSKRMTRPRPLDYDLNEGIIEELEQKILQIEKNNAQTVKMIRYISISTLFLFSSMIFFPIWQFFSFAYSFLPSLILGALLGKTIGNFMARNAYEKEIGHSKDFKSFKRFKDDLKKYQEWFVESRRKFWKNQVGLDFEYEICELLKCSGLKVRKKEFQHKVGYQIIIGNDTLVFVEKENGRVTSEQVIERYRELKKSKMSRAIIVSKTGFNRDAIKSVKFKPIKLWDINQLVRLQQKLDK